MGLLTIQAGSSSLSARVLDLTFTTRCHFQTSFFEFGALCDLQGREMSSHGYCCGTLGTKFGKYVDGGFFMKATNAKGPHKT